MRADAGKFGDDDLLDEFVTPQETPASDAEHGSFDEDELIKDLEELEILEAEEQSLAWVLSMEWY